VCVCEDLKSSTGERLPDKGTSCASFHSVTSCTDLLFIELRVKSGDEGCKVSTDKEEWLWLIAGICH